MRWRWLERTLIRYNLAFTVGDPRPLTEAESLAAIEVFGGALALDPIRIVPASILNAPAALGNVIRIPPEYEMDAATLIHELAHVWQYQTRGTAYISDSVWHQFLAIVSTGTRAEAYRLTRDDLAAPSIHDLPAEKQAVIIERWSLGGLFRCNPNYRRFLAEVRNIE